MNMAGLLDFLQGASKGFWAGNLGAPVDMAALAANGLIAAGGYAGHRLGLLQTPPGLIEKPVGGSEWIADKMRGVGLLQDNPGSAADAYGQVAGGLLWPVVAAKSPQIAGGLLQAADNLAAPTQLNKQAGVIRAKFVPGKNPSGKVTILDDGTAIVEKPSGGFKTYDDFRADVFDAAREKFGTSYDDRYFRFTNNPEEIALARAGQLRNSMNHADGFQEKGLSVADHVQYSIAGYKYGYPVMGKWLAWGSDGEPLLDPKTIKVLGDMRPARELMIADKKLQGEILKKAGLPDDYFNGVTFENDMHNFAPWPSKVE